MAQFETRNYGNDSVTDAKARLRNNNYLRGRNAANSADISIVKVRTDDTLEMGELTRHNFTPTDPTHIANKSYVDDVVAGMRDPKDACKLASTANVDVATGGLIAVDGVTTVAGYRVLLKNQTTASENGIWVAASGAWSRSTDADSSAEVTNGMSVDITAGTANANTRWLLTTADPITLNTTSLTFVKVPTGASSVDWNHETKTLNGTDISNQYVDLAVLSIEDSVQVVWSGSVQRPTTDFTLSTSGGVTRVTFAGDLATGGNIELISGDVLYIQYSYYP